MRAEPTRKRCMSYFDGQNLFHAVRDAFGYTFPNYDPLKLAQNLCSFQVWQLVETRFCIGPATLLQRGINGCDWIRIDRRVYDSCIDPNDYRKRPLS